MQRKRAAAKSPPPTKSVNDEKLAMIRSGKKKKTITGFKENKNITIENKGGKFVMVEKEKKFEEAGVTRKKRNFIMFESKLGTEKETDLTKIAGVKKKREVEPRTEERIIQTKKRKEYLDNYQYHESKVFRRESKPSVVIHQRLGDIVGGIYEQRTYDRQKVTTDQSGKKTTLRQFQTTTTRINRPGNQDMNQSRSSKDIRNKPDGRIGRTYNTNTSSRTSARNSSRNVRNNQRPAPSKNETEYKTVTRTRITNKGGETKKTTTTTTRGRK